MNGFKAHLQVTTPYSSGTDDVSLAGGAYRLILWKNLDFGVGKGWELDAASGALIARTPGLKLLRGHVWMTAGMSAYGVNTVKIIKGDTLADVTAPTGSDVDAAIYVAPADDAAGGATWNGTGVSPSAASLTWRPGSGCAYGTSQPARAV